MYHIKSDKRCIKSAEIIVETLEKLLQKKPFPDITITDIQKTAGIGRSTFYRHFDTIDDVVYYSVDKYFNQLVQEYEALDPREFTQVCLKGVIEKSGEMANFLSSGHSALVTKALRKNMIEYSEIKNYNIGKEAHYSFAVFAASCIAIIKAWDEEGRQESVEELAQRLEKYLNFSELESVH